MTTTGPAEPEGVKHRAAMWLGHYAPRIELGSYAVMAVMFTGANAGDWPGVITWSLTAPGLTALVVSYVAMVCDHTVHRQNLCLRDLNQSPLLNPQAEVERRGRLLRFLHSRRLLHLLFGSLAVLFGGILLSSWMRNHDMRYPTAVFIVGYLTSTAISAWNVWATDIHRRLYPWCPLCRWGRGPDDDEDDPEPEPTDPTVECDHRKRVRT